MFAHIISPINRLKLLVIPKASSGDVNKDALLNIPQVIDDSLEDSRVHFLYVTPKSSILVDALASGPRANLIDSFFEVLPRDKHDIYHDLLVSLYSEAVFKIIVVLLQVLYELAYRAIYFVGTVSLNRFMLYFPVFLNYKSHIGYLIGLLGQQPPQSGHSLIQEVNSGVQLVVAADTLKGKVYTSFGRGRSDDFGDGRSQTLHSSLVDIASLCAIKGGR